MNKDIEVEMRGPLTEEKYLETEKFLGEFGVFKENKERLLIAYTEILGKENMKEITTDFRLRCTNGIPEIILKLGEWGGSDQRQELSVLAKPGEFDKLVQIFGHLGHKKGIMCVRRSKVFDYKGIEFALVEVRGHSYYFEAEIMAHSDGKEEAMKKISDVCRELGLAIFSQEEFYQYIEKLNNESNEIFDFDNYKNDYFQERFQL